MAQLGKLEYLISVNDSKLKKGISDSDKQMRGLGDRLSSWAVAKGQAVERIAETAVLATGRAVKGAVVETMDFDKSMAQVAATLGKSVGEVQDLAKFARKMGAETAFTAQESAQALNYMALAGYDSEKSMRMLPQVLNLAAAGGFDLARASDMVTDAQSALGLSIEGTESLVNQMALASSKTNTSVEQLGDAMLTVGGTAKMLSGGTEELSIVLGLLADNGIKGSEGGTALRNVLLSLSAPTDKAKKQLQSLGVNVFDAEGNMRSMQEIMLDMGEAMDGMTQEQRTNIISEIFNKRDLKSVEALLGTTADRWKELYEAMGLADADGGAASKMAKTQLDNLAGDVTIFKSALGEAKISLVEGLTPSLRSFVRTGTTIVQRLTKAWGEGGFLGTMKELKNVFKDIGKGIKTGIARNLKLDDIENASWGDIAKKVGERIKGKLAEAKIKIADLLAVEEPENATWGDIAGKIVERIKGKIGEAKLKIADLLGIEDAEDATWGDIAGKIVERIKGKVGEAKLKIADLLGIEDSEDATWGDIAGNITTRIKGKIGEAKLKIADLLGIEEPGDATWTDIGGKIKERLTAGMSKLKLKAADILGIENPDDATWADIGKNIMDGLTKYVSNKGNFLKQLVLGDEYTDKSTWMDVGKKITGWLDEAFAEGGILDAMLGNTTEKAGAIAAFAGNLVSGIADWIRVNSPAVAEMITNVVGALVQAAPKIAEALSSIFKDSGFQDAFSQLIVSAFNASMEILSSLFEMLGDILGKAIFGEEWYEMKKKEKERVQTETGSYKGDNEDWNTKAEAIDERYNMHVTEDRDSTGAQTDAMTATMMHLGISGGMPTWWNEYKQLSQLVNLRKIASGADNSYLYEAATAGLRAFGDGWQQGLRQDELSAAIQEAMDGIEPPEIAPEINVSESEVDKVIGLFDGVAINIPVHFITESGDYAQDSDGGGSGHSFAKGEWNVPYDNFPSLLHRGEMVLTKSQARKYRDGEGGADSAVIGTIVASAVQQAMSRVYVMMSGEKVGDLTTKRVRNNMNARSYSKLRALGG